MKISSRSRIDIFMKALGARKPSPGGGAASALAGALGAALMMKIANFTVGKKKYRMYEKDAKAIFKKAEAIKNKLNALIEKDARSYGEYAMKRSKESLDKSTMCVAQISKLSKEALKYCVRLKGIGNRNLKGDLYTAESLLNASAKSAENLVKLNRKRV